MNLTDEEIVSIMRDGNNCNYNDEAEHIDFAHAVIAAYREKLLGMGMEPVKHITLSAQEYGDKRIMATRGMANETDVADSWECLIADVYMQLAARYLKGLEDGLARAKELEADRAVQVDYRKKCSEQRERITELEAEVDNIKQVEFPKRIVNVTEALKKRITELEAETDALKGRNMVLEAQRDELLGALEFYANPSDYKAPYTAGGGKLYFDCGNQASAAIAKIKGEGA